MSSRFLVPLLATFALGAVGCTTTDEPSGTAALYVIPSALSALEGASFLDHPWPSDVRLENGSPRLAGYYNPRQVPLIQEYIEAMTGVLDGFSPVAPGYLRFSGPLDPASLPATPAVALEPAASVQLVDVDPSSPEYGQRKLVSLAFREPAGVYYLPNTLSFLPTVGFPLRPHTRYALAVTDAVRAADGGPVAASTDLRKVLGLDAGDARTEAARAAVEPAVVALEGLGLSRERLVHLAVFTTSDPTAELFAFRDALRAEAPAPTVDANEWFLYQETNDYQEYFGSYGPTPNYQAGTLPFESYGDGGQLNVVNGVPTIVDLFSLRFSLTVPSEGKCPMGPEGYPIVLYAHGSGGNYRDYALSGIGKELAQRCLATMGVDQIFHGKRPGAPTISDDPSKLYYLFFNFQNVVAARANARQSALDEVQRARLFTETQMTVPSTLTPDGREVRFDPSKVLFFGHSQGGLNGPLFLAADDASRGGVMSGSGGMISIALLEKTEPQPSVAAVVKTLFLALNPEEEAELDLFHPALSLAQTIVDVVDPLNYARFEVNEPRPGFAPKSYLMTEGINPDGTGDSYAPPHGIEALALAIGLPLMEPYQRPIAELSWGGPQPVAIPPDGLTGNLANGAASGVLAQWAVAPGSDGHFVVYDVNAAKGHASKFLRNLAREPEGRVSPP
jgi:hypothetical protein